MALAATGTVGSAEVLRGDDLTRRLRDTSWRAWLRDVVDGLRGYPTLEALHASDLWREEGQRLERLLATIQMGRPPQDARRAAPLRKHLRIVHWNILKGIAFDAIAHALAEDPDLAGADIILLNEADVGMARSGNKHVAAELGRRLGLHWTYIPSYLELTKGPGAEADSPGENEIGLHGVAILTRREPRAVFCRQLPECFDMFSFGEKRYGRRTALLLSLDDGFIIGTAHLEVRNTPACRARQMRSFIEGVDAFGGRESADGRPAKAVLLAGDFNTHTFARGTLRRGLQGLLRIQLTSARRLRAQLVEPWRAHREPLFEELRRAGYRWEDLNDRLPSAFEELGRVEEIHLLPRFWGRAAVSLLRLSHRKVAMRLDWFAGKGVTSLEGEHQPRTVGHLCAGRIPSDHAPLVLEITR